MARTFLPSQRGRRRRFVEVVERVDLEKPLEKHQRFRGFIK